jgi:hypothetical protein
MFPPSPAHNPKGNRLLAALPEAAGKLQAEGLIQYIRGKITVLDRLLPEVPARSAMAFR